ncbi:hypothetical protein JCM19241_2667 [Vibrio ishigakensis]|uniref:Uncharacterized protein n=1 Tax=Vibrio ishigakensis TaxID=1481914 RepID=A0A0B8Q8D1_9VIBR|nr:hypothetical protein JCM19241_2667 [Vibrio ishigakensis]
MHWRFQLSNNLIEYIEIVMKWVKARLCMGTIPMTGKIQGYVSKARIERNHLCNQRLE